MARALPDHLGKREIILPARYRVISDSSEGESEFETRRGTRRSSRLKGESAPVRMPTKGKPGNKKSKAKTKNNKNDGWITDETNKLNTDDEDEFVEVYDKIKHNKAHIHFVADNCAQLFSIIFSLLSHEQLTTIANKIKGNEENDHVWVHSIVGRALEGCKKPENKKSENTQVVGNSIAAPPTTAVGATPAAAAAAAAPAAAGVGRNSVTNNQDKYLDQIVRERVKETLEETQKKRNIIISGMIEGNRYSDGRPYNDMESVSIMLDVMGLGHLESEVLKSPTRLGPKRWDGKFRPLKVELKSEWAAQQILDRKYDLPYYDDYYYVFINKDLSREERNAEIAARKNRSNRQIVNAAMGAGRRQPGQNSHQENVNTRRATVQDRSVRSKNINSYSNSNSSNTNRQVGRDDNVRQTKPGDNAVEVTAVTYQNTPATSTADVLTAQTPDDGDGGEPNRVLSPDEALACIGISENRAISIAPKGQLVKEGTTDKTLGQAAATAQTTPIKHKESQPGLLARQWQLFASPFIGGATAKARNSLGCSTKYDGEGGKNVQVGGESTVLATALPGEGINSGNNGEGDKCQVQISSESTAVATALPEGSPNSGNEKMGVKTNKT